MSNNIYNTGQPLFSKTQINNPEDQTEVNGNNINFQRLPSTIARNDIYGENEAVDGTERILAPNMPVGGVDITLPLGATTMQIASTSADDTLAGIGAQVVGIFGLDVDYNIISENLDMNGLTPVSTTLEYFRIQETAVITSGSTLVNQGNIYLTDIADTFTGGEPQLRCYDSMQSLNGLSKTATFTVPAGQVLTHQLFELTTTATGNNRIICRLKTSGDPNNIGGISISDKFYIDSNLTVVLSNTRRRLPKQDIWLTIEATGQTVSAHAKLTTITSNTSLGERNLLET